MVCQLFSPYGETWAVLTGVFQAFSSLSAIRRNTDRFEWVFPAIRRKTWKDLFSLHSKGAEFIYSREFEDINYETVERNNNKETPYINILNNQDLKKKYDSGEIRIPDNIMSKYKCDLFFVVLGGDQHDP